MSESAFELNVEGLDKLLLIFRGVFAEVANSPIIMKAMNTIGKNVENQAKSILDDKIYSQPESPYYKRTQMLKGRTTTDTPEHDADGNPHVKIRSRQHYASYIEMGTVKMKARPFLRPAVQQQAEASLKVLTEALNEFLKSKVTS